eukprot:PhF_6_TR26572/c0_g1_i1/m.38447
MSTISWLHRDTLLYAVSVGSNDLAEVYECHPQFRAIPTAPLAWIAREPTTGDVCKEFSPLGLLQNIAQYVTFDPAKLLHGEEVTEWVLGNPLPTSAMNVPVSATIRSVQPKGTSGIAVVSDVKIGNFMKSSSTVFLRGAKMKDGVQPFTNTQQTAVASLVAQPKSKTIHSQLTIATTENQSVLYRINGDGNPIHVDPALAVRVQLGKPILHGLCTYAMVFRTLCKSLNLSNGYSTVVSYGGRFAAPVYNGDTLEVSVFTPSVQQTTTTYSFEVTVKGNGKKVMTMGYLTVASTPQSKL